MKRGRILENICRTWLILVIGMCVGCGKNEAVDSDSGAEIVTSVDSETDQSEEQPSSTEAENLDERWNDTLEIDFAYDYSEDIKTDVDYMVSVSDSLQEELENIEKITQKYTPLAEKAQTQGEMNVSSRWLYVIWDTELNDLWNRFSKLADPQTKEQVLTDQRNWIAMKEEATFLSIGSSEENGSMYPLLQNSFLEEITKNRAYILAEKLAEVKGEIEGTFIDQGDGKLVVTSDDGSVKGVIQMNGWNGASFTVTEVTGESPFAEGEVFEFPFVF